MSFISSYLKYFEGVIISDSPGVHVKDLNYLRKLIFSRLLALMLPIGFLVLIPSIYISLKTELYIVTAADLIAFAVVALASFHRSLPVFLKMLFFAAALYVMAVLLVINLGSSGPGFIYLLGVSICVTLIINSKSAYLSILLNAMILFSFVIVQHFAARENNIPPDTIGSVVIIINFLFVNVFAVFSISMLLEGLNKSLKDNITLRYKAEESNRLISSFLMNISHEIRTPVNSIIGFTGMIRENPGDQQSEKYFTIIEENSYRLINTLSNILNASLLKQGQLKLDREEFDLNELLQEVYQTKKIQYKTSKEQVGIVFLNQTRDENVILHNDKERLRSVLSELIDNAFKFSTKGVVTLSSNILDQQLIIKIRDEGKGISKQLLVTLFEFFQQGEDSLTRGYDGLGLGLPIAKGILELMGYTLVIQSTPGTGTSVTITIPLNQDDHSAQLTNSVTNNKLYKAD